MCTMDDSERRGLKRAAEDDYKDIDISSPPASPLDYAPSPLRSQQSPLRSPSLPSPTSSTSPPLPPYCSPSKGPTAPRPAKITGFSVADILDPGKFTGRDKRRKQTSPTCLAFSERLEDSRDAFSGMYFIFYCPTVIV